MFKQSIRQFTRSIRRKPVFSTIHFLGLTIGITTTLFIFIFVSSELEHDKFHANSGRIHRINQTFIWGEDNTYQFASTGPGVAVALQDEVPEFESVVRVHTPGSYLVSSSENPTRNFDNDLILAADSGFFDVFTFPTIHGNHIQGFEDPNTIVLTRDCAVKYFGTADAKGKTMQFYDSGEKALFTVVSVIENIPQNSYIEFDILVSMSSYPEVANRSWSWIWTTFETYALINDNANVHEVRLKLKDVPRKHAEFTLERVMGVSFDEYIRSGKKWDLYLQPLEDIHLGSAQVYNRLNEPGNKTIIQALIGVAFAILFLTSINYLNLKSTQIFEESKNSGLMKLLGAARVQIIAQHIFESFLFVVCSIIISWLIAYYFLEVFNFYSGSTFGLSILWTKEVILYLTSLSLVLGLLNGILPAYMLSRANPLQILNKTFSPGKSAEWIRRGFIIVQFSLSLALLASTLVVFKQLEYLYTRDLGFRSEGLVTIEGLEWIDNHNSFLGRLRQFSAIEAVSYSTGVPPDIGDGDQFISSRDRNRTVPLNYLKSDEKFLNVLGAKLRYGRIFSDRDSSNYNYVILNESALKALDWPNDDSAIGSTIIYPGSGQEFQIIGIVKDFHYWSLNAPIEPLALFHNSARIFATPQRFAILRVQRQFLSTVIEEAESVWKEYDAEVEFSYNLVTDQFQQNFRSEERFRSMLSVFAAMAFAIAMLGLFGVVLFSLKKKMKELSIRKVLGAGTKDIVLSTFKLYLSMIIIAGLISVPLTYYYMEDWLRNFQYRIEIEPGIFISSIFIILLLTSTLLLYQTMQAARSNPAHVLRDD